MHHLFKKLSRIPPIALSTLFLFSSYGYGALPPLFTSVSEIEAILQSDELADHIKRSPADPIIEIKLLKPGLYRIVTTKESVFAAVTHTQINGKIGPGKIDVNFVDNPFSQ